MGSANPILPEPGKRNILITSALPYVNNSMHSGIWSRASSRMLSALLLHTIGLLMGSIGTLIADTDRE
jgi:hypothetical protein